MWPLSPTGKQTIKKAPGRVTRGNINVRSVPVPCVYAAAGSALWADRVTALARGNMGVTGHAIKTSTGPAAFVPGGMCVQYVGMQVLGVAWRELW